MPLKINSEELTNSIGIVIKEIGRIQKEANQPNPDSDLIESLIQKIQRMLNTITKKEKITKTTASYTDRELEDMKVRRR